MLTSHLLSPAGHSPAVGVRPAPEEKPDIKRRGRMKKWPCSLGAILGNTWQAQINPQHPTQQHPTPAFKLTEWASTAMESRARVQPIGGAGAAAAVPIAPPPSHAPPVQVWRQRGVRRHHLGQLLQCARAAGQLRQRGGGPLLRAAGVTHTYTHTHTCGLSLRFAFLVLFSTHTYTFVWERPGLAMDTCGGCVWSTSGRGPGDGGGGRTRHAHHVDRHRVRAYGTSL